MAIDTRRVLMLREYETAAIGDVWDPARRVVSHRVVNAIERLQARCDGEVFVLGRRSIQAQQWVGTIGVDGVGIDLLPKTDQGADATRANLVRMLGVAGIVPAIEGDVARLDPRGPTIVDAVMNAYVKHLAREWRQGRISGYRKEETNRTSLRGKLVFGQHLRRNLLHPERFYTDADEFLQDVPLTRLLKAGLHVCRRYAIADGIRRGAIELLSEFETIRDIRFSSCELDAVKTDRRTARFETLTETAKVLVAGDVHDRPGQAPAFSFVFDMNEYDRIGAVAV